VIVLSQHHKSLAATCAVEQSALHDWQHPFFGKRTLGIYSLRTLTPE